MDSATPDVLGASRESDRRGGVRQISPQPGTHTTSASVLWGLLTLSPDAYPAILRIVAISRTNCSIVGVFDIIRGIGATFGNRVREKVSILTDQPAVLHGRSHIMYASRSSTKILIW